MPKYLLSISLFLLSLFALPAGAKKVVVFPDSAGQKVKYNATIEMEKGYLSGICILANDGTSVNGCLFNEFGISALDFTYQPERGKVKILSVIKMLDKWYIKRVLKRDLAQLMQNLAKGIADYHDTKYKIDYHFTVLQDATPE